MTILFVGFLLLVAAPHRIDLERSSPAVASTVWLGSLIVRAVGTVLAALTLTLTLAASPLLQGLTHWCWHENLPMALGRLPLSGHLLAGVVMLLPFVLLASWAAASMIALCRGARHVRRLLRTSVARGPESSLILCDQRILVGSAGFHQPRVVVSAGALLAFDDAELSASLAHERGHIVRRHRFFLAAGDVCSSIARILPGTRTALDELTFHLERDADRYAVAANRNPLALASAISKAAWAALPPPATLLGGGCVTRRIRLLLTNAGEEKAAPTGLRQAPGRALACLMLVVASLTLAVVPPRAHASAHGIEALSWSRHCPTDSHRAGDPAHRADSADHTA